MPVSSTSKEMMKVKVWARRVWTLELSLVSPLLRSRISRVAPADLA